MKTIYNSDKKRIEEITKQEYDRIFFSINTPKNFKKICVKTGSVLSDESFANNLAYYLSNLKKDYGINFILVPSGTIKQGTYVLNNNAEYTGFQDDHNDIGTKQAKAAFGVSGWAEMWRVAFSKYKIPTATILLTEENLNQEKNPHLYKNCVNTVNRCWDYGGAVIANENDTVYTKEITFGDNDNLASKLAIAVGADGLFTITREDGFYDKKPLYDADGRMINDARLINVVPEIDKTIEGMAGPAGSKESAGGMYTKVNIAAKRMTNAGKPMMMCNGNNLLNDELISELPLDVRLSRDNFFWLFHGGTLFIPKS